MEYSWDDIREQRGVLCLFGGVGAHRQRTQRGGVIDPDLEADTGNDVIKNSAGSSESEAEG